MNDAAIAVTGVSMRYPRSAGCARRRHRSDRRRGRVRLHLLGRSGCGKSTPCSRSSPGSNAPATRHAIDLGGRRVGMIFQDSGLFPWLTVQGNIELALRLSGVPRAEWAGGSTNCSPSCGCPGPGGGGLHELSGGMRQRVALARSLAQECQVLLMDEPFAALDAITRDAMHDEIERIAAERRLTVLFVTHNVREAVRLGDRVAVMRPGPGRITSELPPSPCRARAAWTTPRSRRARQLPAHDLLGEQALLGDERRAAA